MNKLDDTQFGIYATTATIAMGLLAYLVLQFADYVDDLTVPCQHGTDIVDGECSCVDTPFAGSYCEISRCENGIVTDVAVTTPFVKSAFGCRCNDGWFGFLCDVCNMEQDSPSKCDRQRACKAAPVNTSRYFGDRCGSYCSATLTRETHFLSTNADNMEYTAMANIGATLTHCSGHGTCTDNGCDCDEDWFPAVDGVSDCEVTCPTFNGTTCNKPNGVCVQEGGRTFCRCRPGYVGDACQYKCPNACTGQGICAFQDSGGVACLCDRGFVAEDCSQKCPTHESFVCAGHGTCSAGDVSASCACDDPWELHNCRCNAAITCSGHGTCSEEGCVCSGNYEGTRCNMCKPTFMGDDCQLECVANMCNAGVCGVVGSGSTQEIRCQCPYGFDSTSNCANCAENYYPKFKCSGDSCIDQCSVYISNSTCFHNGVPNPLYEAGQPQCMCNGNFSADTNCETCLPNHYPPGICDTFCDDTTCKNGGTCDTDTGLCICDESFGGPQCDRTCDTEEGFGGSCGDHGRCVANDLQKDIAFSCVCEDNYYGAHCNITCPSHDNQVCNAAGLCSAKKIVSSAAQCQDDHYCSETFGSYERTTSSGKESAYCHKPKTPATDNPIYGCSGEPVIELYDPFEVGSTDGFYYFTEDNEYLYPVFHAEAGQVLEGLEPYTIQNHKLYLRDYDVDNGTVVTFEHSQIECKLVSKQEACDVIIGCTWTPEFCDLEMQGVDEYAWCDGVLEYGNVTGCENVDAKGCDVSQCSDPMLQNEGCDIMHPTILQAWEHRHYLTDPLAEPSLLLDSDKDPFTLKLDGALPMTTLCERIAALPEVTRDEVDSPADETTIVNHEGFHVCEETVDTWAEALALKENQCIITPGQHAEFTTRMRPRDMCRAVSSDFSTCAPGFNASFPNATAGDYNHVGKYVEFYYNTPSSTDTGPRILFRDAQNESVARLFIDQRVYFNQTTEFRRFCPIGEENCNRAIARNAWYHIRLVFENDTVTLQMDNAEDVVAEAGAWTFFEIVELGDERIHNLLVYDDASCASVYRKAELPYGVTSDASAVELCAAYEALEEPHDTFDFEAYCAFAESLVGDTNFTRKEAQDCARLVEQNTCGDTLTSVCSTLGVNAEARVQECETRAQFYPDPTSNATGVPPNVSAKCVFDDWTTHCRHLQNRTLQGTCAVARCECNYNQKYGLGGDACELTCPVHTRSQSPCGIEFGLGKCVSTGVEFDGGYLGVCECANEEADETCGGVPCRNEQCNLNQTDTVDVRGFQCNSSSSQLEINFVRRVGECVNPVLKSRCTCDEGCAGYQLLDDGNCTECTEIVNGYHLIFEKTPIQKGEQPLTVDECASLTASLSEGFCEIKYDGKLVRTYSDGDCTKETTDSGCTVNGIVQTIPECTVVFTAGKCNDGTGDCDCQPPYVTTVTETQEHIFGDKVQTVENVYFGTHKRLNMMQGLDAYLVNHVKYNGESIDEVTDALRDLFRRTVGSDEFECDNPTYARPYEYCDNDNDIICTYGYACIHHMCQKADTPDVVSLTYSSAYCSYDNMIRATVSKRSPFTGLNCDEECPGVVDSPFPEDFVGCSGHGSCTRGTCNCDNAAFLVQYVKGVRVVNPNTGEVSDLQRASVSTNAMTGWRGTNCSKQCPGYDASTFDNTRVCSGHGECSQNARCICESGWTGRDDNGCTLQCPSSVEAPLNECSGHGTCEVQLVGPVFGENNDELLEAFGEDCPYQDFFVDMMSAEHFSTDGTLETHDYTSRDKYYAHARFEWEGTYDATFTLAFRHHQYTFRTNDTHIHLPHTTVVLPTNRRVFVEMDEHAWRIGIDIHGTAVLYAEVVDVSYPFTLKVNVTSGTVEKLRLAVGTDGSLSATDLLQALQPIDTCDDIGWTTDAPEGFGKFDHVCWYDTANCTIRYFDPSTNPCQRGTLFPVNKECKHPIKNAFTWTRPTITLIRKFNKDTVTERTQPQQVDIFPNLRYKAAVCRCLPGWAGFDCNTCERGLGGSTCQRQCPRNNGNICDGRGVCQWGSYEGLGEDFFDASCVCGLYGEGNNIFAIDAAGFSLYEGDDWIFRRPDGETRYDGPTFFQEDSDACTCQDGYVGKQCNQARPTCLFGGIPGEGFLDANCECAEDHQDVLDPLQGCCPNGFVFDHSQPSLPLYFTSAMEFITDRARGISNFSEMVDSDQRQISKRCEVAMYGGKTYDDTWSKATTMEVCNGQPIVPMEYATPITIESCTADQEYSSTYVCEKAYDENSGTSWAIRGISHGGDGFDGANEGWILINFASTVMVSSFRYEQRPVDNEVDSARLSFSDGTSEDVLFDRRLSIETKSITPRMTSFIRFKILTGGAVNPGVTEIEFWGPGLRVLPVDENLAMPEYEILSHNRYCNPYTYPVLTTGKSESDCGGNYANRLTSSDLLYNADPLIECAARCWSSLGVTGFYTYATDKRCMCASPTSNPDCSNKHYSSCGNTYGIKPPQLMERCQRCDPNSVQEQCAGGLFCVTSTGEGIPGCSGDIVGHSYCTAGAYKCQGHVLGDPLVDENLAMPEYEYLMNNRYCSPNADPVLTTGKSTTPDCGGSYANRLTSSDLLYNSDGIVECAARCWNSLGVTGFYTFSGEVRCKCGKPEANADCSSVYYNSCSKTYRIIPQLAKQCQRCDPDSVGQQCELGGVCMTSTGEGIPGCSGDIIGHSYCTTGAQIRRSYYPFCEEKDGSIYTTPHTVVAMPTVTSCTESSSYSSSHACANLFDNDPANEWVITAEDELGWVEFTFDESPINFMAYESRTSTVDRVKLTFSDGSSERLYLRADMTTYKLSKTYLTTSVRFEMEIVSNRDSGNNPGAAYLAFYEGDGEPSSAEHFVDMYENYHPVCRTCNTEFGDPCVCPHGYTFVEQNLRINNALNQVVNPITIVSCEPHSEYNHIYKCENAYDSKTSSSWAIRGNTHGWESPGTGWVTLYFEKEFSVSQVYILNRAGTNDRVYRARLTFSDGQSEEISLSLTDLGGLYTLTKTYVTSSVHYDIIDASGNPGNPGIAEIIYGAPYVSDAYSAYMLGNDSPYAYEPNITTVNTCDKCAPGLFLTQGVQFMTCAECPAGFYQNELAQNNCKACSIGKYRTELGASSVDMCTDCASGKYNDETGAAVCTNCPTGYYQSNIGMELCNICQSGKYQNEVAKTGCKNCVVAKYQNLQGQTSCKYCASGKYQNEVAKTGCKNCASGKYQNEVAKTGCKNCATGQYQNEVGKTGCKNCAAGQYQDSTGQASCKCCAGEVGGHDKRRKVSAAGGTQCSTCPGGWEARLIGATCGGQTVATCDICPASEYSETPYNGYVGSKSVYGCNSCGYYENTLQAGSASPSCCGNGMVYTGSLPVPDGIPYGCTYNL